MISRIQIDFKKYNADGIGSRPTTLPRVDFAALNQPWADKSTTPMVLVHVHRFHQPTNKTTQTQSTPNEINHPHEIHPNETVGAVPVCPPERSRSGVSIREIGFVYHALCAGILTTDAPLQGDAGGHTGTAPTHLHQTMQCAITSSHYTFDSPRQPHGVSIPHRIAHSIAPNHAVCPYPSGLYFR